MNSGHDQNRRAWDERVALGLSHTERASEREFQAGIGALAPAGWLDPDLSGCRVLCLAAGGGKHSVLAAALGARVTVLDLSARMLESDRLAASERGLHIEAVQGSMDNLAMLADASFDLILQPVSTCYVPEVAVVYREVARVIAPRGLYISQHKQPACLQADAAPTHGGYLIREPYYRRGPLPALPGHWQHRESGTVEYLHRIEDLLGGLCRAGFVIEDVVEPDLARREELGGFADRCRYLPPFLSIKARRRMEAPKLR